MSKWRKPKMLVQAVRVDTGKDQWGIWVAPKLWIAAPGQLHRPNVWWRFWQYLLLGWVWGKLAPKKEHKP